MSRTTTSDDARDDWADIAVRPTSSGFFVCDSSWTLPTRRRPHYQLWAITSGSLRFRIGAGAFRTLGPRTLILLPPHVAQRADFVRGPLQTYVTYFMAFDYGVPSLNVWHARTVEKIPTPVWQRIVRNLEDVTATVGEPGRATRLLTTAALTDVLGQLETLPRAEAEDDGGRLPPLVAAAVAEIRRQPAAALSTRTLAEHVHCSPETLRSGFRRALGQSPGGYVKKYRMSVAKSLLRDTDLPIAAVARNAGYPDPFYFSRIFRASEGVPPSQWRESLDDALSDGAATIPPSQATGPD